MMRSGNLERTWCLGLILLAAPVAWADTKPKAAPPPKPAPHPSSKTASKAPSTAHPRVTTTSPNHVSPTVNHPGTGARANTARSTTSTPPRANSAGARSGRSTTRTFSNGTTARFNANGRVQSIHTARGLTVTRTAGNHRIVSAERNGRTLVSTGPHSGYMQRSYMSRNGREYFQRTYVVGGRTSVYVYNRFAFRGAYYYGYVPGYYFRPAFYAWAFNPWVNPVYYRWGWRSALWYEPYSYYFAPAPVYPVASLWLADYLIAENLRAAYDSGLSAGAQQPVAATSDAQATVLTPEIKQAIADEIKRQIDSERASAAAAPEPAPSTVAPSQVPTTLVAEQRPAALDPAVSIFVVSNNLDVTAGDQGCSLSPGDVITRVSDSPDAQQNIAVKVTSSKRADCPTGQQVVVAVADLQEMHNQFSAKIDSGLKMLAANQGQDGLPAAPDTQTIAGEVPTPSADAVRVELQSLRAEADQAETEVKSQNAATGRTS